MPVLVTDAHTPLGERLVRRLLETGGEVRAWGSGVDAALRAAGAIVANGDRDDEGRLEAALEQVHTVVHFGVGLLDRASPKDVVEAGRVLVSAAEQAGVRRIVALSVLGAGTGPRPGDFAAARGECEHLFAQARVPSVVVRTGLIDTAGLRSVMRTASLPDEALSVEHAPVRDDDLVEVLVGFDAVRATADTGHVVFEAVGPDRVSLAEYIGAIRRRSGGRVGDVYRPIPEGSMLVDALLDAETWASSGFTDAFAFLGLEPRPLDLL